MIDVLDIVKKYFEVTPCDVPDEFASMKTSKMKTAIEQYDIAGLGNMTMQHASGMMGLMKMEMVCITPLERDMPLFSLDIIDVLGNYTVLAEFYDVTLENRADLNEIFLGIKDGYSSIPDGTAESKWYDDIRWPSSVCKKGKKKKIATQCDDLMREYLEFYVSYASKMDLVLDKEAKRLASDSYVQGLLDNGGPSTDVFVDMLGKEKTTEYFKKYIFGTEK